MNTTETELCLATDADTLRQVLSSPTLAGRITSDAKTRVLESLYFDTPERTLWQRGVGFRIRRVDGGFIQTVKTTRTDASGLTRSEWEWPVDEAYPHLDRLEGSPAAVYLDKIKPESLLPLFMTRIERTTALLDDGQVEAALDLGEIVSQGGARAPVAELELELKTERSPDILYELGLALLQHLPMRPESRTKAARGYALARGLAPQPEKFGSIDLDAVANTEAAMVAILRACLNQAQANAPVVLETEDPEGVHQMRVALRRFRSALGLFKPCLPSDQRERLNAELKWLGDALGPARDLDVFSTGILAPVRSGAPTLIGQGDLLDLLTARVENARGEARAAARTAVASARYGAFVLNTWRWLDNRDWRNQPLSETAAALFRPAREVGREILEKRLRTAKKQAPTQASATPEQRHQFRIALKKLRYAADFLKVLYPPKPTRRFLERLSALQDVLGDLNDVAVAGPLLADLTRTAPETEAVDLARAAGVVVGWHAKRAESSPGAVDTAWNDLLAAKPFWRDET